MRRALIGMLMAATAVTPLASAAAQVRDGGREIAQREDREERRAERERRQAERAERREERRAEPQAERREGRAERRGDRVERRQDRIERRERAPAADRTRDFAIQQQRARELQRQRALAQRGEVRRDDRREWRQDRRNDRVERRDDRRDWRQDRRYDRVERRADRRDWRNDRRYDRRDWSREWRNDRRYDWQRYRYSNRDVFRGGRYWAPYRGHNYSRFSVGLLLEPLFYSDRYWINDPWYYRLPPAYEGTRWVRYYDDVLLVDLYSGEVLDVIHDFFW